MMMNALSRNGLFFLSHSRHAIEAWAPFSGSGMTVRRIFLIVGLRSECMPGCDRRIEASSVARPFVGRRRHDDDLQPSFRRVGFLLSDRSSSFVALLASADSIVFCDGSGSRAWKPRRAEFLTGDRRGSLLLADSVVR